MAHNFGVLFFVLCGISCLVTISFSLANSDSKDVKKVVGSDDAKKKAFEKARMKFIKRFAILALIFAVIGTFLISL